MIEDNKIGLIDKPVVSSPNGEAEELEEDSFPKKYVYDASERKVLLDQACTQINKEKETIHKDIKKLKKLIKKSKDKDIEEKKHNDTFELLKKQLKLLNDMVNHLVQREKSLKYYKTEQERIEAQERNRQKNNKSEVKKSSKNRTRKEFKSSQRKKALKKRDNNKNRGIHSTDETKYKRSFSRVIHRIFYLQEKIDFKELYKEFNIS